MAEFNQEKLSVEGGAGICEAVGMSCGVGVTGGFTGLCLKCKTPVEVIPQALAIQ